MTASGQSGNLYTQRAFPVLTKADIERKAIADAQKIVSIWNAREAGGTC
jgi:hypothetical protein